MYYFRTVKQSLLYWWFVFLKPNWKRWEWKPKLGVSLSLSGSQSEILVMIHDQICYHFNLDKIFIWNRWKFLSYCIDGCFVLLTIFVIRMYKEYWSGIFKLQRQTCGDKAAYCRYTTRSRTGHCLKNRLSLSTSSCYVLLISKWIES